MKIMKRSSLAAQIYSFRDFIRTKAGVRETFLRLHDMGYGAVQLSASIAPMPEEELLELLSETGLEAPTAHEPQGKIIENTAEVIAHLKKLKCPHAAYPYPHFMPTGEGEAVELALQLNRAAEEFRKNGLSLAYHNHAVELNRFGGKFLLDLIYDNAPLLEAEFDTYWLWRGGTDPVKWLDRFAGRAGVLHLKDYGMLGTGSDSGMLPVGSGALDWDSILSSAKKAGVRTYVVEHDGNVEGDAVFSSFAASAKFLERYLA